MEPAGVADSKWRVEATTRPLLRPPRLGDERLARLAARGSSRAFAAVYERYHQPLYRYCRSILRDDSDAQDALQSTFTRALAALKRDQRSAPLRPWLFRIAHNEAISLLRRRRRGEVALAHAALRGRRFRGGSGRRRARLAMLMADLAALPERARSALVMRELSGLSHEEIAIALDTSPGAAKQAIFEARRALAECAEGRAMACADVCRAMSDGDRRVLRGRRVRAHLRDCPGCAAFASSIEARQSELRALVPVLPAAVSAAVLSRAMEAGVGGAGARRGAVVVGAVAARVAAGAAGKTIGVAFGTKGFATASLLATAAVSVGGVAAVVRLAPNSGRVVHARPAPVGCRLGTPVRSAYRGYAAYAGRRPPPVRCRSGAEHVHDRAAASRHVRFTPGTAGHAPAGRGGTEHVRSPAGHTVAVGNGWGDHRALEAYTARAGWSSGANKSGAGPHTTRPQISPDLRRSRALNALKAEQARRHDEAQRQSRNRHRDRCARRHRSSGC